MTNILLEKEIKKYTRATKRFLDCPKNYRDKFIKEMEHDLAQFIQENDSVEIVDIINYFGTPEELARTYLECVSNKDIKTYKFKRKRYYTLLGSILSIIVIVTIVLLSVKLNEFRKIDSIYVDQFIDQIKESTK